MARTRTVVRCCSVKVGSSQIFREWGGSAEQSEKTSTIPVTWIQSTFIWVIPIVALVRDELSQGYYAN